jgi:hypothetical protein
VFDVKEFHSRAWKEPLAAADDAKKTPQGWYHLDNKCEECDWITAFVLRGLIRANAVG